MFKIFKNVSRQIRRGNWDQEVHRNSPSWEKKNLRHCKYSRGLWHSSEKGEKQIYLERDWTVQIKVKVDGVSGQTLEISGYRYFLLWKISKRKQKEISHLFVNIFFKTIFWELKI